MKKCWRMLCSPTDYIWQNNTAILFACRIPEATNTHSEYIIIIAFLLQQLLCESASVLRYTCIAGLTYIPEEVCLQRGRQTAFKGNYSSFQSSTKPTAPLVCTKGSRIVMHSIYENYRPINRSLLNFRAKVRYAGDEGYSICYAKTLQTVTGRP